MSPKSLTYGFYITWLRRSLLGLLSLVFSMQLLAKGCSRPSLPGPWSSSPTLPVRTRLSQPRGGCGEAGAGCSCLCSALKLQPGPASRRSLPGEVPAPACFDFFFPLGVATGLLFHPLKLLLPVVGFTQCWGQPQNVASSPQSAAGRGLL